jgi:hypothetical protein
VQLERGQGIPTDQRMSFFLLNFGLPAQLGLLAIWSVRGTSPRLTKAAWLTVGSAVLLYLSEASVENRFAGESLGCNLLQVLSVVAGALVLTWLGIGRSADAGGEGRPLRWSLMEMFGWSIIVAVWAFAVRFGDFRILSSGDWWLWYGVSTLVPLAMLALFFGEVPPGTRVLRLMVMVLTLFLVYGVGRKHGAAILPNDVDSRMLLSYVCLLAFTQVIYLAVWWAVMRMDDTLAERRRVTATSREKLALFDPRTKEGE